MGGMTGRSEERGRRGTRGVSRAQMREKYLMKKKICRDWRGNTQHLSCNQVFF